jgi:DNA-binding NarL/FixJ family response regulator
MVSMLADYFELLWAKAVTLGGEDDGAGPLPAVQRRILRLASQGFKDESIARILGLSSRSVRRNMEKLATRAGAGNRFTLGIAAARLGWI